MFITLNSCLGICLSPLHLFLLVGFYLVRSSRTCSSFASFCLSCCWYFVFLVSWLCAPALEEWSPVGDLLLSQQCTPLSSPKRCALMTPCCAGPSVVLSKLCGLSGRLDWLLVRLVAKPCPVQRLLAPGW